MTTHHWHTGHNMPGYMPDGDIWTHRCIDDAIALLVDDLVGLADSAEDDIEHETILAIIEKVKVATGPSDWATPDGYVNWITHCTEQDCMTDLDDDMAGAS